MRSSAPDLLLDVGGGALGGLQVLHQLRVSQEVPRGGGQAGQQVVLQRLQGDLEAVLLLGQVGLQGTHKGFISGVAVGNTVQQGSATFSK